MRTLRNYDFANFSQKQIFHRYFDLAKLLTVPKYTIEKEKFNKLELFRSRLNINIEKEDINLVSTYSYPPPSFCIENGRANLKNKTVFYCSDEVVTAINESRPKNGDEVFLSIWKPITTRDIECSVCLPHNLNTKNRWSGIAKEVFEKLIKYYGEQAQSKSEHFIELNRFLTELFLNEKKPYSLTSMISNEHLYNGDGNSWKDFLVYPSSATNSVYCNLAIHPNFVNSNLELVKVINLKIKGEVDKFFKFNIIKVGELKGNKMIWRANNSEDSKYFSTTMDPKF